MPGVELKSGVRVVALPAALDAASWPPGTIVMRIAPDEVVALGAEPIALADPHALVEVEDGWCAAEWDVDALAEWMEREAEWKQPTTGFAQGMAAGLPVKVWVGGRRAVLLTRASLQADLEERL